MVYGSPPPSHLYGLDGRYYGTAPGAGHKVPGARYARADAPTAHMGAGTARVGATTANVGAAESYDSAY